MSCGSIGFAVIEFMTPNRRRVMVGLAACAVASPRLFAQAASTPAEVVEETWLDKIRSRQIPVKLRWPDAGRYGEVRPVIIFSHGLGGTTDGGAVWGEAWAAAGFVNHSISVAGSVGDQLNLLGLLATYFTNNPDYEDPAVGVTGAAGMTLKTNSTTADAAFNTAKAAANDRSPSLPVAEGAPSPFTARLNSSSECVYKLWCDMGMMCSPLASRKRTSPTARCVITSLPKMEPSLP